MQTIFLGVRHDASLALPIKQTVLRNRAECKSECGLKHGIENQPGKVSFYGNKKSIGLLKTKFMFINL